MLKTSENVVVIPQEYEKWQGVTSLSRVRELLGVGLTKRAVADRFKISVQSIDKAFAREQTLAKRKAASDKATSTNPETGDSNGVSRSHITVSPEPRAEAKKEGA